MLVFVKQVGCEHLCVCAMRDTRNKNIVPMGHTHFISLLTCSKSPHTSLSMIPIVSAMDEDTKASSLEVFLKELKNPKIGPSVIN